MMLTGDPIRDHEELDRRQQRRQERYPKCCECGLPITGEKCFEFGGKLFCADCLEDHERNTEDYID